MKTVKLRDVVSDQFTNCFNQLMKTKPSARTAFKLKTIAQQLGSELTKYNEVRKDVCLKFCKKDENGNPVYDENNNFLFDLSVRADIEKELNPLLDLELSLNPLSLDDLDALPIGSVSGEDLVWLSPILAD